MEPVRVRAGDGDGLRNAKIKMPMTTPAPTRIHTIRP